MKRNELKYLQEQKFESYTMKHVWVKVVGLVKEQYKFFC